MKKVKVLNVQFDVVTKNEALARIFTVLTSPHHETGRQIVTPNPEMLLAAAHNKEFQSVLNRAWMSIPDGIGILWASAFQSIAKRSGPLLRLLKALAALACLVVFPKFIRTIFPERLTGVDLMESVCSQSRAGKFGIFLLGARLGVAERVKDFLEMIFPGVHIVGTFSGSPSEDDFSRIQSLIAETQPALLFVAYGSPAQELWIAKHLPHLKSVKIAMGVGGAFDFLAGERKRAPRWMQRLGLEWMYRLAQEPGRLKRIWNATVRFPWRVWKQG